MTQIPHPFFRLSTIVLTVCASWSAGAALAQDPRQTDGAPLPPLTTPDLAVALDMCAASPIAGVLGSGSPQWPSVSGSQTGRLNRNGVISSCAAPKGCLIFNTVPGYVYDAYRFANESGSARCMTVSLENTGMCNLQANAYLNTYNPASICTGHTGDMGFSISSGEFSYSINVPAGDDAIIVVHSVDVGVSGCTYNLTISPCTTQQLYVLDAFGGVHLVGENAVPITPAPPYFGFEIARDMELTDPGAYVLAGLGSLHLAGGAPPVLIAPPPYFGADIARDLEMSPHAGGYVLDGFGGVHGFGGAGPILPTTPYFGFDIARDMELTETGYYVIDGFGGLHRGGAAPAITPGPPYFGFDAVQDLELAPEGGGYVLDSFGGVHAIGGATVLLPPTPYFGFPVAADFELGVRGFFVLDRFGGLHRGGNAPAVSPLPPYFGFDAARDLEIR